jgi:excisionase family DNA binding protein
VRHLTVIEAAEALHLSVPTIKRYIYEGKLDSTKLPGGQRRIAESEIQRLLAPQGGSPVPAGGDASDLEQRVVVLETWMTEVQADLERIQSTLEVIARYCARSQPEDATAVRPPSPPTERRLLILGPGCRRCDALYELTVRVRDALGRADLPVERVTHLDDISAFGPVMTPTLVLDDEMLVSGRVPSEAALRKMLEQRLT